MSAMTTTTQVDGTVFIVDDDPAVRESLGRLCTSAHLPYRVFGTAKEFLEAYDPATPGCLVLDVRLPGMSGIELQKRLAADGITIPVIIITGYGDVSMVVDAMQQGAIDFMEKPINPHQLLDRAQQALTQDAEHRRARVEHDAIARRLALLTPREREVVYRVVAGMTNKQIAYESRVSSQAIDAHRVKAMGKLRVNNVPELVRLILRAGPAEQAPKQRRPVQPLC